ncbi:hypothetical protein CLV42_110181 [Chitinophaga ginsengisoli]|uniref:Uncharacterized protein n=1 Tax=Chitinophaga ginsengisoli TaxID=363837 RepID=A0A2P8FZ92_9BACT|nr:hypothetical protein CLV42_110181 [Chitinophaga ginsengisoli]
MNEAWVNGQTTAVQYMDYSATGTAEYYKRLNDTGDKQLQTIGSGRK